MNREREFSQDADPQAEGEFQRLIGGPVNSRNYIPRMDIAAPQTRRLQDVRKRLTEEARMMGESAYYGWGTGKDAIEGPSVKLAMAAARCWGNCAVESMPMQETNDAYVFTSRFLHFETGYTLERQFRQSKNWVVYGKHDPERKADIRFQIGQSKSARNLVLNALPEWLIAEAMEEAKAGVREKVEAYVKANGIAAAADLVVKGLVKAGAKESAILGLCGVAKREGLKVDDIVLLRGCLKAIQDGAERPEAIFPEVAPNVDLAGQWASAEADFKEMQRRKANGSSPAETTTQATKTGEAPPAETAEATEQVDPLREWLEMVEAAKTPDQVADVVRRATEAGFDVSAAAARRTAAIGPKRRQRDLV